MGMAIPMISINQGSGGEEDEAAANRDREKESINK
jgi:hypothetical protein